MASKSPYTAYLTKRIGTSFIQDYSICVGNQAFPVQFERNQHE